MDLRGVHFRILAEDVPGLFDFYTEKLGFEVHWGNRDSGYAEFSEAGSDRVAFALFPAAAMTQHKGYAPLPPAAKSDQAIYCMTTEDVDAHCAQLREKGVEMLGESADMPGWGMRCAYFRDPEGNLFEINGPMTEGPNPYEQ